MEGGGDGHTLFQGQSHKLLMPHWQKFSQQVIPICKGGWEMCLFWEEQIQGEHRSLSEGYPNRQPLLGYRLA